MLIDFVVKRGRIYMDIRDFLAMLHSHPDEEIGKKELIKAINDWHNEAVRRYG